ncbi:glycosyltransferase [Paenibacillus polygoni]|uniref:Glycosyltransferase n=1 Tax=Paenibacillus polygoni TaxID=3050112 RepID=A0ABY8X054_9BACL|nr:glycosyltransferase [Paenibacillus polygoni]WIV18857.1 glycosyltransferase [Paenibacillus polygoni]
MNKTKILGVYKWATMGGVERVLLNRAHAIQQNNLNIEYHIYFFFDSGGKEKFNQYLECNNLTDIMKIVDYIDNDYYDYVLSIDTPEIFEFVEPSKLFMECHTSYKSNRSYLKTLDSRIKGILVPSEQFKKELEEELSEDLRNKLIVISNSVHVKDSSTKYSKIYNKTPILYVGRLDKLKNIEELVKIISSYNSYSDELILILAGPIIEHDINLKETLEKHKMLNRTIYLPPVDFDRVGELLHFVKKNRGIFMSASISESYGLSVAEAMKVQLPVLAYDNQAHYSLLNGDQTFLFEGKDLQQAHKKLEYILSHYDSCSQKIEIYSQSLEYDFTEQWISLFT